MEEDDLLWEPKTREQPKLGDNNLQWIGTRCQQKVKTKPSVMYPNWKKDYVLLPT